MMASTSITSSRSRPLKIYLADLTYTTLSLATEAFPLNVGFVGAMCKGRFGGEVEVRLFKYIEDLYDALTTAPPDVLGMSNYPWNLNLDLEFFRIAAERSPRTLRVMGGPNLPQFQAGQDEFMMQNRLVDAYVYLEGEAAFANIVEAVLGGAFSRSLLALTAPSGAMFNAPDGTVIRGASIPRRGDLGEIPSPYLAGLMDPFFDDKLSPMLETNRGCPFSCTFCHEGNAAISKVHFFPLERVKEELDYVASRRHPKVSNLIFADPNFGMYERDFEICEQIARIQRDAGWPKFIFASTGKNQKERIARALKVLGGAMKLWMSVQSMDEIVLKEIKRENIRLDHMMALRETFEEMGLATFSELILGLPGDTPARHMASIAKLVDAGVDTITTYTLMLLNGTELATPESRARHGLRSHFRVLPRDFARLPDGSIAVEAEEVCTATATLSFEDYCRMRNYHLIVNVAYNTRIFQPLFRWLRERGTGVFPLLQAMLERLPSAPASVRELVESFARATREELWEDREALLAHYRRPENYERLVAEAAGTNLIQTHVARATERMTDWCSYLFATAASVLPGTDPEELGSLDAWCSGRVHNPWGADRMKDNPRRALRHDVGAWLRSAGALAAHRLEAPQSCEFRFTASQEEEKAKFIERFGTTASGLGRILVKMDMRMVWREDVVRVE